VENVSKTDLHCDFWNHIVSSALETDGFDSAYFSSG